jgi:hypothetical protein
MSKAYLLLTIPILWVYLILPPTESEGKSKHAELRLRIMPDKETYSLHDEIFTKVEFTNVSNLTVCFPEPAQEYVAASQGVLTRKLIGSTGTEENERFLEVFDGAGTWPRDKLIAEIKTQWVRLAPNETYVTKSSSGGKLNAVGKWQLEASYRPPEGSFKPAAYRKYLASAAKKTGCTLPQMDISANKIVSIVSP